MRKLFPFLSSRALFFLALFLTVFIPLFPKLPLFDIVQTWVYIRLEDFFVLISAITLLTRVVILKFRDYRSPLTLPIGLYLLAGFVSLVFALIFIFPGHTGQLFPHLALLHYIRRIEYLSLFFLGLAAFSGRGNRLSIFIGLLTVVSSALVFYGVGQKLWGFPAFLTMNEEFAKGLALRLPPTARISSTFGGHYDLAAFLVMVIPIFGALAISAGRKILILLFFLVALSLYVLLLLTASRVSFGVYLIAILVMLFWSNKKWLIIPIIIISFFLLNFVSTASERFYKTLRFSDVIVDATTGRPIGTLDMLEGNTAVVKRQEEPDVESLPHGSEFISAPTSGKMEVESVRFTRTDLIKGGEGEISTVSGSFLIQKAFVYDISITTRFQGQWPKAIEAFRRNLLLGSGYSSLSVAADGDYLRMLGETGIVGSVAFLGIFAYFLYWFLRVKDNLGGVEKAFVIGFSAGLVGLLVNALLIDVFEASKVAYMFYLMLGVATAILLKAKPPALAYLPFLKKILTSDLAVFGYIVIVSFLIFQRSIGMYFTADDFTWLRWAKNENATSLLRNFVHAEGFFYRPISKLLYFIEYSFFWLKPTGYHLISIFLFSLTGILVFKLTGLLGISRPVRLVSLLWYLLLSVHHENVIWISGQSSLLAAAFLLLALLSGGKAVALRTRHRGWEVASYIFCLASAISYDGMVTAPLVLIFFLVALKKGWRKRFFGYLSVIPVYLLIRFFSGAVPPSGDYAVNVIKLPVNMAGNLLGYVISFFGGVSIFENFTQIRSFFKNYLLVVSVGTIITLTVFVRYIRKCLMRPTRTVILSLAFLFSLGSYLGLGNLTERYALSGSAVFALVLASFWDKLKVRSGFLLKLVFFVVIIWSSLVNYVQLNNLHNDWQKASDIVNNTLLSMKKEFFPLFSDTEFAFINTPIRYGRAWIFPTGLNDPLWHIFHINNYWFKTYSYKTFDEALANDGTRTGVFWFALEFDNDYNLYRTKFNVATVPDEAKE
jgi:hypothetical protein